MDHAEPTLACRHSETRKTNPVYTGSPDVRLPCFMSLSVKDQPAFANEMTYQVGTGLMFRRSNR